LFQANDIAITIPSRLLPGQIQGGETGYINREVKVSTFPDFDLPLCGCHSPFLFSDRATEFMYSFTSKPNIPNGFEQKDKTN